jgi:hypothetical protein
VIGLPAYDVVLLPAAAIGAAAVSVSKEQLARFGTEFTLADGPPFPHLSLYMAALTPANAARAADALAGIAAATTAIDLTAVRYSHDAEQGMFEVTYANGRPVDRLQRAVLDAVNPLRSGLRDRDAVGRPLAEWLPQTSGETRRNLDRYGYDEIGGLFRPHLTFTRFRQRDFQVDRTTLPPWTAFSGSYPRLGLFEMGAHGTCVRSVAEFPLTGS